MATERRQCPRVFVRTPMLVLIGDKVGMVIDLSEGGLSVRGLIPKSEAGFHFISFSLPEAESFIQALSEIAWTSVSENRTGLRFLKLGERAKRELNHFVARKPSLISMVPVTIESVAHQNTFRPESDFKSRKTIAGEVLLPLIMGSSITVLLSVLRKSQILPGIINILLRPGAFLAYRSSANGIWTLLGDAIIYGSLPFVVMRLRSRHRRQQRQYHMNRRRSQRVPLAIPVFVYTQLRNKPFFEVTETIDISATGGFMPVSEKMVPSQKLILTNMQTDQDSLCHVVRSVDTNRGKPRMGIEFVRAPPDFWSVIVSGAVADPPH